MKRLVGSFDTSFRLAAVGANDVDVQLIHRARELRRPVAALRKLRVHAEDARLIAVECDGPTVLTQISLCRFEIFKGRFNLGESKLHNPPRGVVTRAGGLVRPVHALDLAHAHAEMRSDLRLRRASLANPQHPFRPIDLLLAHGLERAGHGGDARPNPTFLLGANPTFLLGRYSSGFVQDGLCRPHAFPRGRLRAANWRRKRSLTSKRPARRGPPSHRLHRPLVRRIEPNRSGSWNAALGFLFGTGWPHELSAAFITCSHAKKVRARFAQAECVGATPVVGVVELHAVVLPEADCADIVGAGWLFVECEVSAARTCEQGSRVSHRVSVAPPRACARTRCPTVIAASSRGRRSTLSARLSNMDFHLRNASQTAWSRRRSSMLYTRALSPAMAKIRDR